VEGWGEETREKCKEIFWFLHTRVRERVRGALVRITAESGRTRQFQATTRSARAISRSRDLIQNTFELRSIHTADMTKYFYIGILVIVVAGLAAIFLYKTSQPVATAEFGGVSLRIEYATTTTEREKGLGGRTNIPDDYGMLFIFPKDDRYGFWMKDMFVPIDIFWLNDKGQVISMAHNVATSSYPDVFYPIAPALYVLETSAGFADEHNIATGTPLLLKNFPIVSQ